VEATEKQWFRWTRFCWLVVGAAAFFLTSCSHLLGREGDREKARLYMQMAADRLNERQYNQAVQACLDAQKVDPSYGAVNNLLALIYMETKRYEKSEAEFLKALDKQPQYSEVQNNLGVLMNRQEKYKKAISYFKTALEDDTYATPENALTNMGYSYFRLGNNALAKTYHQQALDLVPTFCLALKNMGDVFAKEKNYQKAADNFDRATTHCPLYQESQYKLSLALMKLGKRDIAKNKLEQLVQAHKSGPYVERSNEVLKYLQ